MCKALFLALGTISDQTVEFTFQRRGQAIVVVQSLSESCSVVSDSLRPHGLYSLWNSPGQNTGVGSLSLLQGIFPTQGLNPGLLHCRQILYQLSHKGSLNSATSWAVALQATVFLTISWNLLKFMSIELVMLSNHFIFCHPLLVFAFSLSQHQGLFHFTSCGQSIKASALATVLPMNVQGQFSLGLISLQSKGLSAVFSSTTIQKCEFFGTQPFLWSNSHICT